MPGSAQSIAGINIVINAIVAEILGKFANRLEKAADVKAEAMAIIRDTIREHKRIIFNGNNYSEEWVLEAERRGLPNLKTTPDAMPTFVTPKNIKVFVNHDIFTEKEIRSRYEILLEDYSKAINIEALTMLEMAKREILPAAIRFSKELLSSLAMKKASGLSIPTDKEEALALRVSKLTECLMDKIDLLDQKIIGAKETQSALQSAQYYREKVFAAMQQLRASADELETVVGKSYWPFPTYSDLLFHI